MKFHVHLVTQVRVKIASVEAEDPAQALKVAEGAIDFADILNQERASMLKVTHGDMRVDHVEWFEAGIDLALIDPLLDDGEIDESQSVWMEGNGELLKDGKTAAEIKIASYDRAELFMGELLDSVETLTEIATTHGARTLANLMYLHSAILSGGFVEFFPEDTDVKVSQIVEGLPSAEKWLPYIRMID